MDPQDKPKEQSQDVMHWEAAQSPKERGGEWYIAVSIIVIFGILSSLIYGNFLFALLIVVVVIVWFIFDTQKPEQLSLELSKDRLHIDDESYPYSSFDSFWILEKEGFNKVIFESEKILLHHLSVPLGNTSPEKVRSFLIDHLPERETPEPLSHQIAEYLGF